MADNTSQDYVYIGGVPYRPLTKDYVELKKLVRSSGALEPQPLYYVAKVAEVLIMYAISIAVMFALPDGSFWLHMMNAIFLGFAATQSAFLLHDAGHRSIAKKPRANNIIGWIFGNLFTGSSTGWWIDYHNEHHAMTNEVHADPAIDHPFWAFDDDSAVQASGFWRFMVRWQAYLYVPLMLFQVFFLRIFTFQRLLGPGKVKNRVPELITTGLHVVLYVGILFSAMPWYTAVAFIIVQHAFAGVYTGMVFAPNHKGMPTIEEGQKVDFMLQQTITTRNVAPHPIVDYLFGGLNYQIEHHLFPGTPRNRLKIVRQVTKEFCEERGIPYHELGLWNSYKEMFGEMDETGRKTVRTMAVSGD